MTCLYDDRVARMAERDRGRQPPDEDEDTRPRFVDLTPAEQTLAMRQYVGQFSTDIVHDALTNIDVMGLMDQLDCGDAAIGAFIRAQLKSYIGHAIDRAVDMRVFEL